MVRNLTLCGHNLSLERQKDRRPIADSTVCDIAVWLDRVGISTTQEKDPTKGGLLGDLTEFFYLSRDGENLRLVSYQNH